MAFHWKYYERICPQGFARSVEAEPGEGEDRRNGPLTSGPFLNHTPALCLLSQFDQEVKIDAVANCAPIELRLNFLCRPCVRSQRT